MRNFGKTCGIPLPLARMTRRKAALSVEQMSQISNIQTSAFTRLRVAGHFGELLQGRLGARGPLALISLPCPVLWVDCDSSVPHTDTLIGPKRFDALCQALGIATPQDRPGLIASMPLGGGAGSSTAGLVALARMLGFSGPPQALARICVQVEGASDPLMFPHAERLLFAPREGRVLRNMPALPRFDVVGGFFGPVQRTDPADTAFPDITDLVADWRGEMTVAVMAALVTASARRTLDMRGPYEDPTQALATELGAAGWLIAHTGNARGLIFPAGSTPPEAEARLSAAGFQNTVTFSTGGPT